MSLHVRHLQGLQHYAPILTGMQQQIKQRQKQRGANDELWLLQHYPVYTLGQAGDHQHILDAGDVPVIRCDRGGQVTYHGPGQLMLYTLLDLKRLRINTRELVRELEQWIIDYLRLLHIDANNDTAAPGVYTDNRKICSIGLRVSHQLSYHGLAFNIAMDLSPFERINPCGFADLQMTQLSQFVDRPIEQVVKDVVPLFAQRFGYSEWQFHDS